jgi:hypothetical protein
MKSLLTGGFEYGNEDSTNNNSKYRSYYDNEIKIYNIPLYRSLSTFILIYSIYVGIDFISGLCTTGIHVIFSFALLWASLYFGWALWYDANYAVPVTWSYLKDQGY